ncbi:MAG: hypothetical protein E7289_08210 [Lachnospiraceae bacterium]|nr:hypothetical protein [Lachnospiraceae bacterium]
MVLLASGSLESVVQLITSLLIFAFVLAVTFWTTKFVAKYQKNTMNSGNMEVVEVTRIAPNKYLQIVRVGGRYFLISVGKDNVNFIAELQSEDLHLKEMTEAKEQYMDFKSILEKAKNSRKKQADKNE